MILYCRKKSTKSKKSNETLVTPSINKKNDISNYFVRKKHTEEQTEIQNKKTIRSNNDSREEDRSNDSNTGAEEDKKETDQNRVKKTFASIDRKKFQETITKFKQISKGIECVVRSGYCTSHNTKMVRSVNKKRMSNEDECGKVTWTMREATTLTCPVNSSLQPERVSEAMTSQLPKSGGTNQKRGKFTVESEDQSPRTWAE